MREIKFRALLKGKKPTWEYSDEIGLPKFFTKLAGDCYIPESVGQYIGLPDKNGQEIYEGDVVNYYASVGYKVETPVVVAWGIKSHGWSLKCKLNEKGVKLKYYALPNSKYIEVIGDKFSNPELLE